MKASLGAGWDLSSGAGVAWCGACGAFLMRNGETGGLGSDGKETRVGELVVRDGVDSAKA